MATRKATSTRTAVRKTSRVKSRVVRVDTNDTMTRPVIAQLAAQEPSFELVAQMDPQPTPAPEPESAPEPETAPTAPEETSVTSQIQACTNCAHMPMGVNTVVSVLVALVFTLSSLVVASAMIIDSQSFQLSAYSGINSVAQR